MVDEILWTSGFINERIIAPISPLGWSHIGPLIEELALRDPLRFLGYPDAETIPLTRLWRGLPYANARAFRIFYKVFPDFFLPEDAYRYFPNGDVSLRTRAPYPRWRDAPRVLFSLLRAFFADPFNVSPLHNYRHWARYVRVHDARVAALRARVETLVHAEPRAIFDALREVMQLHCGVLRIHRWSLIDADLTFGLLKRLVAAWVDREHVNEIIARLVADVPNKTLEIDTQLRQLSNLQSPICNLQDFLAEHGHRSFSIDIAVPTFAEAPEQVMQLLSNDERRKTKDERFSSFVIRPSSWWKRTIFDWVLALARHYLALREDQRYYWQKSLALARRLYLMLADRLVTEGVIAAREEVFYATHDELVAYFDHRLPKAELARAIAARQAEWREYQRAFEQSPATAYPPFLQGDVPLWNAPQRVLSQWRGRAISPGVGRGVARVVHTPNELVRVQYGDVLVAPATDPAWTPVFARLAGLVVERGGVLSHSAVVAREYRVPAVAGIANIVAEIRDGEIIEVDGSRGCVSRVVG
ncbi:MAG: PEP-utilizing enzyme [Anaerolineae bacterium]|nr:PEP-utilizing enzyme [Anaerolineae bacterium]